MNYSSLLKSKSSIGSFGEFLYFEYTTSLGFDISRVSLREVDFVIHDKDKIKEYKIDVKTTVKNKVKYTGTRFYEDVIYDLIVIYEGMIKIIPDSRSPLILYGSRKLGSLEEKYKAWIEFKNANKKIKSERNDWLLSRLEIKKEIVNHFRKLGLEARVVFRGSVSRTRWNSSPDNLPGSQAIISKYNITIYIQLRTEYDVEVVHRIFSLPHDKLGEMPFISSNNRQKNKGIDNVIDWDKFIIEFKSNVFDDIHKMLNSFG
jgi:hypothetical protein